MTAEPISTKEHLLTLKVMRLTKPGFYATRGQSPDKTEEPQPLAALLSLSEGSPECPSQLSDMLVLPQNFENIYLGETFTCYICVHNDTSQTSADVAVKVDLQTSSQRVSLPSQWTETNVIVGPTQTQGQIISHEVKEIGQHILVCAVTYANEAGEQLYFRKFFKFSVSKPLDVKTKFYNPEDNMSDDVFLEAQIQNLTDLPMFMEKVSLEPSELYYCNSMNGVDGAEDGSVFASLPYLAQNAARQYLFQLRPRPEVPLPLRGVTAIGRLEMIWRTTMGERGRLQTSQLQRMAPGHGDLRVTVVECPSVVKIRQPFQITCALQNCVERNLDLKLDLDPSCLQNLVWASTSNRSLGQVPSGGAIRTTLTLVPTYPGLQAVSGIRLTDAFLGRTYEHDDIAQVFVYI